MWHKSNYSTSYRLTVRTLDFHSNNAGSIPADSRINPRQILFSISGSRPTRTTYDLIFVSLLPVELKKMPTFQHSSTSLYDKLAVKKSFLIFLWLHYLKSNSSDKNKIKIVRLPSKSKLLTLPKAPMAHKKTSKEQFLFSHTRFKVSFSFNNTVINRGMSEENARFFADNLDSKLSFFETNLFFLYTTSYRFFVNTGPRFIYK